MNNQPPPYEEKANYSDVSQIPNQMNTGQSAMYPTSNVQPYPPGPFPHPPYNPQYNQNPNVVSFQPYTQVGLMQPQYGGAPVVQTQYAGAPMTTVLYQANVLFTGVPQNMTCQYCHCQIITGISYESGGLTWLLCFVLFMFSGFFGCCFIPFCVNACKDVHHFCPNCKAKVGIFRRIS